MTPAPHRVLEGVFRELVSRHMPLGMRDYLDGLRALNAGFGHGGRSELRLLCHRLWARNDFDRRTIDLIFSFIPTPADSEVQELNRQIEPTDIRRQQRGSAKRAAVPPAGRVGDAPQTPAPEKGVRTGVSFTGPGESGGIALTESPPALAGSETYVLTPQALYSERQLAVLWRRLRKLTRTGTSTELDVEGTVREKCRSGVLQNVALRPARRNTSDLLVFADVSPSMTPWRPFVQAVAASLPLGNLRKWRLYYFSNHPREWLFLSPNLKERIRFRDVMSEYREGVPLLIFGDAGAARGGFNPRRVAQTAAFFRQADLNIDPIVWINPMPRPRWAGTSAEPLLDEPRLSVLPLERDTLIRAIDVLRGEREP